MADYTTHSFEGAIKHLAAVIEAALPAKLIEMNQRWNDFVLAPVKKVYVEAADSNVVTPCVFIMEEQSPIDNRGSEIMNMRYGILAGALDVPRASGTAQQVSSLWRYRQAIIEIVSANRVGNEPYWSSAFLGGFEPIPTFRLHENSPYLFGKAVHFQFTAEIKF